jgi:cell division protein ZapA
MAQVAVLVNNQNYTLACDDGEEQHLGELAKQIDQRVAEVKKDVKSASEPHLLLMAALLLADDYEMANERIRDLEEQIAGQKGEFLEKNNGQTPRQRRSLDEDKLSGLLESAARRMEDIAARFR